MAPFHWPLLRSADLGPLPSQPWHVSDHCRDVCGYVMLSTAIAPARWDHLQATPDCILEQRLRCATLENLRDPLMSRTKFGSTVKQSGRENKGPSDT